MHHATCWWCCVLVIQPEIVDELVNTFRCLVIAAIQNSGVSNFTKRNTKSKTRNAFDWEIGCKCPGFVCCNVYLFAKFSMENEMSLGKTPLLYRAYHFVLVCVWHPNLRIRWVSLLINMNVSLPKEMNEFIKIGCLAVTKETNTFISCTLFFRQLVTSQTHTRAHTLFGASVKSLVSYLNRLHRNHQKDTALQCATVASSWTCLFVPSYHIKKPE